MNEQQTNMLNYLSTNGHWCNEQQLEFLLFETECQIVEWRFYNTIDQFQILLQNGANDSFYKTLPTESKWFSFIKNNFIQDKS